MSIQLQVERIAVAAADALLKEMTEADQVPGTFAVAEDLSGVLYSPTEGELHFNGMIDARPADKSKQLLVLLGGGPDHYTVTIADNATDHRPLKLGPVLLDLQTVLRVGGHREFAAGITELRKSLSRIGDPPEEYWDVQRHRYPPLQDAAKL